MALFGRNKTEAETVHTSTDQGNVPAVTATSLQSVTDVRGVIKRPHITEKAYGLSQKNVYVFEVSPDATKHQVAAAIRAIYQVTPRKVRMVVKRPRLVRSLMRAKPTKRSGLKKAYVYLKEGDTINFM